MSDMSPVVVEKHKSPPEDLEKVKKNLDIGYVPWGVMSFSELDEAHAALKASWNMDTLVYQLHALIENVMHSDVPDKQAKLKALMAEFTTKSDEALAMKAAEIEDERKHQGFLSKMLDIVRSTTAPQPIIEEPPNGITFIKSADGVYRWVATYSNSFRDDDGTPEIISSKSHKRFVNMVDKGLYPLPQLWLWHEKDWKWGEAEVVAVDEVKEGIVMAIAAGRVDKGKEWIAEALAAAGEILPVSHGMPGSEIVRNNKDRTVIEAHQTIEISPLPKGKEANKITAFYVLDASKENEMAIASNKREQMAKALGVDPEALSALEGTNAITAAAAASLGTQSKAKFPPKEDEEDDDDGKKKANPFKDEDEEDDDDKKKATSEEFMELAQVVGAMVKALTETLPVIRKELDELKSAVARGPKVEPVEQKSAAASVYETIMKSVVGDPAAAVDGRSPLGKAAPAAPKQKDTSGRSSGGFVPDIIQQFAQKSASGYRNGSTQIKDYDEGDE